MLTIYFVMKGSDLFCVVVHPQSLVHQILCHNIASACMYVEVFVWNMT
jgi:hypothetical protein